MASSDIYHILLQGNKTIFEDEKDKQQFMEIFARLKQDSNLIVYGYCLMDQYVHLLLEERNEPISKTVQRLKEHYTLWYFSRYEQTEPLFQESFRSESIETVHSFLNVLRYIHQNPVKAGLANNALRCDWTSMREYREKESLVHTDVVFSLFASDKGEALHFFTQFMLIEHEDEYMKRMESSLWSDADIVKYLSKRGVAPICTLQQMEKERRDTIIREMKSLDGVSISQLSRVTGIPKSVIASV